MDVMKLFIWVDPYKIHYGSTMVIAVAENEEDARKVALEDQVRRYSYGRYEDDRTGPGCLTLGSPTRVVDLPCAEWHRWEE
jgi:hypothetical protein